ncbi:hypothetical protein M513_13037 [Trichuris suis]|uniref:Uncharacterized protein n=1 Tax=Trichuris suis TaxID=68888 RepID=A0A085LMA7_9BILA|nr:hypothetical protein M513_13037 [Trichuris suis]
MTLLPLPSFLFPFSFLSFVSFLFSSLRTPLCPILVLAFCSFRFFLPIDFLLQCPLYQPSTPWKGTNFRDKKILYKNRTNMNVDKYYMAEDTELDSTTTTDRRQKTGIIQNGHFKNPLYTPP